MSGTDRGGGRHVTLIRSALELDVRVPGGNEGPLAALSVLVGERDRYRAALERLADDDNGIHFVGDEQQPDECPGCIARGALGEK